MTAARIVPPLDEVNSASLDLGPEPLLLQQLAPEGREEAFAQGVVIGVAELPIDGRPPASRHR